MHDQGTQNDSLHILVVDDSEDNAETLALMLRLEGHEVEAVYSGAEALTSFAAHAPDVALLDLDMPGLNGLAVARQMRASAHRPLTLVAITGWGRAEDREASRRAGFNLHYTKPVDPERLSAMLAACAGRMPVHMGSST
jgi:CheY-like chemotaxis protein